MDPIIINNKEYIIGDDLFNIAPTFCKESRNARELIKNKDIKDFIYCRKKDDIWNISDGKSNRYDKIFIEKSFIDTIIGDIKDNEIEIAPDIIILEEHEKFQDEEGNIINIETRGSRNIDNIYFKVKDVSIGFNIENLYEVLINKNRDGYKLNKDYKYFNCKKLTIDRKNTFTKKLYLTYEGILRVLFVTRSNKTDKFIKWATKTLFIAQMGTPEQREDLATSLIGIHSKSVRKVFDLTENETPGVYLILCGKAKELLEGEYSDNDLLCKFGCSKDINRRLSEHETFFNKEFNTNVEVLCFSFIDPIYVREAEKSIKHYFKENLIKYKNMEELIIISKNNIKQAKTHYKMIQNSYIGCYKDLNDKINDLKIELENEKNNNKLKDKDIELEKERFNNRLELEKERFNTEREKHKLELKDKDIELLQYKIKLLEHNIK